MIKRISKFIIIILIFACTIAFAGCKKKNPTISFQKDTYVLEIDEEITLQPTIGDLDDPEVEYTVNPANLLEEVSAGKYKAISAGTATITAKIKGYDVSASVTVTINAAPVMVSGIAVSGEETMTEDETQTLTATITPADADNKGVTWTTSNSSIATIDENGLVTAVKAGTVTFTATAKDGSGVNGRLRVVIREKQYLATSIDFDIESTYYVGEEVSLQAKFTPTNTTVKVASWESTDPTVATIDASGKLVFVAAGKTTIVAKATDGSNVKASKQVTVLAYNGPTEASYEGQTSFGVGETYQITASDIKSDSKEALEVVYECFDETLEVSETGLVTGISAGSATLIITVKGHPNIELSVEVKVVPAFYVDKAFAGKADGTTVTSELTTESLVVGTNAFATITAAVAKATDGAAIYVAKGTYEENISITKSSILLFGPNNKVLGNATRGEEAIITGKITLAAKLENITIAGFKFTGNAQVVNTAGDASEDSTKPATNLNGFKFNYNLVETGLTSGKGFIYFVEAGSGYSYNLEFVGNKFTPSVSSTLEALVYIDNNTHLKVVNNTFYNAPKKAFYINDTTKGLGGNAIVKGNTFDTATDGFYANWASPSPNGTKTYYFEIENNTFKGINENALFFGRFNNADAYDHITISGNTFTSVGTGVHFDRVQDVYNITVTKNTFTNDPTVAYFSNLWRSDTSKNAKIIAGGNIYKDGDNTIDPKAALYDAEKVDVITTPVEEEEPVLEGLGNRVEIRFEGSGVLKLQETLQLEVNYYGETEGGTPAFVSSDATVASVDETGKIKALKAGEATITVTINQKAATVSVNVLDESQSMNELLKLIAENNNGVVMNKVFTLKGNTDAEQRVYGAVNNYWFGNMPVIKADYMPLSTKKYGVWNEDASGNQTTVIQAERTSTEFIVVHDTANISAGANAKMNSDWAQQPQSVTTASWHYTVGNDGIYQVLENENLIAWHAGDGTGWATESGNTTTFNDTGVAYTVDRPTVTLGDDGYFYIEGQKTTVKYPTKDGVTPHINDLGLLTFKGENGNYVIPTTWVGSSYGNAICARGGNLNGVAIESCVNQGSDLYLTYEYLAKLVAKLLIKYNLTPDRVAFHNNFANKPCPNTMMTNKVVDQFLKMVYVEYAVAKNYADYTITVVSNNPEIIDNTGRVVNRPTYTTNVSYTVTVTKGTETASMTLHSLVIGENC